MVKLDFFIETIWMLISILKFEESTNISIIRKSTRLFTFLFIITPNYNLANLQRNQKKNKLNFPSQ